MNPLALEVERVGIRRDGRSVLFDASLRLSKGEFLGLLGATGAGKTTLLRLIAGLEQVDSGEIRIEGVTASTPGYCLRPEKRRVGMVFQGLALWPQMTVRQHLSFVLTGVSGVESDACDRWISLMGLEGREDARPERLSGGEQQRLSIARALCPSPRLLLLDEPFKSLDEPMADRLGPEVRAICREQGVAVLFVSHDRRRALDLCDRLAFLHDGCVVFDGPELRPDSREVHDAVKAFFEGVVFHAGKRAEG